MFKKVIEEVELGKLCCTQYINQKRKNNIKWSIKNFGYEPEEDDLILVSKDYEIIDGNHRYCALLSTKSVIDKVKVHKINYSKNTYYSVMSALNVFLFILIVTFIYLIF
jgi:hypothetical protein